MTTNLLAARRTDEPDAIAFAEALAHNMVPLMRMYERELSGLEWPHGGDHLQAYTDMSAIAGKAGQAGFDVFVNEFGLTLPGDMVVPEWNVVDAAMDYLVSAVCTLFCFEDVEYDQDIEMRKPWMSVVPQTVFYKKPFEGQEYNEGGLPTHLGIGVTQFGEGPADEDSDDYARTVCWCSTDMCTKHLTEGR